jgi:hypothetical protein
MRACFKDVPLKTYADTSRSSEQLFKTHSKWSNHKRTNKQFLVFTRVLNVGGTNLHAIHAGFRVVPRKTHANTRMSSKQLLKTHSKWNNHKRTNKYSFTTGFKRRWHDLHAIRAGFKVVPLKIHANTSRSAKQLFKT